MDVCHLMYFVSANFSIQNCIFVYYGHKCQQETQTNEVNDDKKLLSISLFLGKIYDDAA